MESVLVHLRKLRVDLLLLFSLLGLMVFGATFILSAAMDQYEIEPLLNTYFFRQLGFYAVGLTLGLFFIVVDYHRLAGWARTAYWITIILLILVLIPGIGVVRYGAQRWFDLGITLIQPSEFAKLAFIFALADFLTRPNEEMLMPGVFFKALGMTALPFLLILKEPDLGSSLVFFPIGTAMMFVAGVPLRFLGKFLGASTVVVLFVIINALYFPADWRISLQEYQRQRLLVYFDKDFAPPNATPAERKAAAELQRERTHNIRQAEISVGSGGLTGKGWGQGPQTRLGYLPRGVAHNDFIFSVIAEETGFLGSIAVLALYTIILLKGMQIAAEARDRLGKLLAVGVVALIFCHVFVNIGMHLRVMPVTGIPLPLLSYGGSSVLSSLIAIAVLQNVQLHKKSY
ncbi:MAG: FtsW/RodA/SpoVE family cell cycle protein [Verrucomicrobiota bacterium]|nr:FtsW/RodA/SpoVE family cell cycle protein [Verrucomicrobiota bacterium]